MKIYNRCEDSKTAAKKIFLKIIEKKFGKTVLLCIFALSITKKKKKMEKLASKAADLYTDRIIALAKSQGFQTAEEIEENFEAILILTLGHEEIIINKLLKEEGRGSYFFNKKANDYKTLVNKFGN